MPPNLPPTDPKTPDVGKCREEVKESKKRRKEDPEFQPQNVDRPPPHSFRSTAGLILGV
jgi:hypothetical protein